MSQTAKTLAQEIMEGSYVPSILDDCVGRLPIDRNPQVVRMVEFFLFHDTRLDIRSPAEPRYLIFQQFERSPRGPEGPPKAIVDSLVKPLTVALSRHQAASRETPADDPLFPGNARDDDEQPGPLQEPLPPAHDPKVDIDRIRVTALERRMPGYSPGLNETELRQLYEDWRRGLELDKLQVMMEPFVKAGLIAEEELVAPAKDANALELALTSVFLPQPFQPFRNPHPHVTLCAVYEQVWEPRGYTRGELINTLSLAPGEQLTLEVHSWDKSIMKTEEEMATESEMRVAETSTQRDALTVARETATQAGGHLDANATIPIKGVPVNVAGGASSQVNTNVKRTLEQTRERTVEAANTLKTTRKLRIEVSREVGREQKQTRVISNTNRCHSVNCHYFEVMANYLVTTQLVELRPCLLIPNADSKVTPAWVLCHEAVLKQVLLDRAFLPGFDGARVLETRAIFLELKKEEARAKGEVASPVQEALKAHVDAICDAYERLTSSVRKVRNHAKSWECRAAAAAGGALGLAACVAAKSGPTRLRRVLYLAMLYANEAAVNALKKLESEKGATNPVEPLRSFFAAASPRDYQFNPATASVAKGLDSIGVPGKLVDGLLSWGLLDLIADDAGLYNAVRAAATALEEAWELPPEAPGAAPEGYSAMDGARAQTAFNQLKCHIEDNWLHYAQAMWRSENIDTRFERLQHYGSVAAILENRILGFLGRKAAYALTDLQAVQQIDFPALIDDVLKSQAEEPAPQLVTLPTHGTILEAMLGQCDSCDDFIRQSRVIDLRSQEAKASQEEAEARRRSLRVEAGDLSDPSPCLGGKVTVTVDGGGATTP